MERYSAEVEVLENTSNIIKLRLSSDISASGYITNDVNLYNEPLTLISQVPWSSVTVTQGSSSKTYTTSNGEVMYEALPNVGTTDRGDIILRQSGVLPVELTSGKIPNGINLEQNYPNPFNPSTKITYTIPELSFITLKVYNVLGKEVSTLVSEEKEAGKYSVEFDAKGLPSGIYFYRLQAGDFVETKKMVLMK